MSWSIDLARHVLSAAPDCGVSYGIRSNRARDGIFFLWRSQQSIPGMLRSGMEFPLRVGTVGNRVPDRA